MIKVLVVDDSALMRKIISSILESDSEIKVVDTAKDGNDALAKVKKLKPDVVTLDIRMPDMSGLDVLSEIMRTNPTPVIMVSSYSQMGSYEAIQAFKYGALDVLAKPGDSESGMEKIKEELIALVKTATTIDIKNLFLKLEKKQFTSPKRSKKILTIGASTGGPPVIEALLTSFSEDFPTPILVVQHMPDKFTKSFAERLDKICKIKVKEAEDGEKVEKGIAYVAKAGKHMEVVERKGETFISLSDGERVNFVKPSVDVTLKSVSEIYGENAIAVILTGMGRDGADGAKEIRDAGGKVIAQDKDTSAVFGMPKEVINEGSADFVLPAGKIDEKIIEML